MQFNNYSRIVISGLSGDSGKTVVSCGLLACFINRGIQVVGFKKGPDYIDSAWLSFVSGKPARNLDSYLMGFPVVKHSFLKNAVCSGINIIEGNRGLFDGVDASGTHSTAELAKALNAPVIIVQNITKVTRTAAANILGCMKLDPDLNIAGVILNQVAGERHGKVAQDAIEEITGIPVVGMLPKLPAKFILPSRHLGLITPEEFEEKSEIINDLRNIIEDNVDVSKIIELSRNVASLDYDSEEIIKSDYSTKQIKVKIGYFRDQSFSFYYPENLELLVEVGAELIPISPASQNELDDLDALYIGGGFPETNLKSLSSNNSMFTSLRKLVEEGLPVYAECGGLMYLAEEIQWKGNTFPLSRILPIKIKLFEKPQGHGYSEVIVDNENSFFDLGVNIKGHEFHYSKIMEFDPELKSSLSVLRGSGCFNNRDGLTYKNLFASYLHVHALATPEWVNGMIKCACNYQEKKTKILIER
ncbi:MAG: hydrogenobyrinic acid a,c-diamide synthase (glutamine-hydrolyzing) [Ignavibacteriaceae bacterium]|nr:hydrogenobyrinic acid a,c-diamide synthase (glutamine-hydrolyzing) [Ignavibacteriaceae bacterium]